MVTTMVFRKLYIQGFKNSGYILTTNQTLKEYIFPAGKYICNFSWASGISESKTNKNRVGRMIIVMRVIICSSGYYSIINLDIEK